MQNKPNVQDVTQDMIDTWKQERTRVKKITVISKINGKKEFIIAKPSRTTLDAIAKYIDEKQHKKVREVLVANCVMAGPVDLLESDIDLGNAVNEMINSLFDKLEVVEEKEL